MGNESSTSRQTLGDGLPFVQWDGHMFFAEPSSYIYFPAKAIVKGEIVFADPPKADLELRNQSELFGKIVVVERGGRLHFPDVMRRLFAAGVTGCIFVETQEPKGQMSAYEGFHSSGRQKVTIPIVRLAKSHSDKLYQDKPSQVSIRLVTGMAAMSYLMLEDYGVAAAVAARSGEREILNDLLDKLKLVEAGHLKSVSAAIALCDAVENGHADCIEIIHDHGISLNEQKPNGMTALMVACNLGNIEAVRALIMYGARLDIEDVHGTTALMITAREKKVDCLKLLLRKGASVKLLGNRSRGTTALHVAARSGSVECLQQLIASGATIDTESPNSTTALMEAARSGHFDCVKVLVDAGASLILKDAEGNTAAKIARSSEHKQIEDYLLSRAENDTIKSHRRYIENLMSEDSFSLRKLLEVSNAHGISIEMLKHEISRNESLANLLQQDHVIFEVFSLLTMNPLPTTRPDINYGLYKSQYLCCELVLWYEPSIYEKKVRNDLSTIDTQRCFNYFGVLFNFLRQTGALDDVLLVLFTKAVNFLVQKRSLGGTILAFFSSKGQGLIPCIARHIGCDSIRDIVVWLLYSDLSTEGQACVQKSEILHCFLDRIVTWQRTLSWGIGTCYQRDAIENICTVLNYIIYPPAILTMGDTATFIENCGDNLPIITDRAPPGSQNMLFRTLLLELQSTPHGFGMLLDLGLSELSRQVDAAPHNLLFGGGCLSIVVMLMGALGYHKKKRDLAKIEKLLMEVGAYLLTEVTSRCSQYVELCRRIILMDSPPRSPKSQRCSRNGTALLSVVTFLRRLIFLQSAKIDEELARCGCMPTLLACFVAHPNNSLLHHQLTDIIRFILLDPAQKRMPMCPLLNSLFAEHYSILDQVIDAYQQHVEYKGHMTTIGNSISTLASTPLCRTATKETNLELTIQEVVQQYVRDNTRWKEFKTALSEQNQIETQSLGQRNAPLCDGCLRLRDEAESFVTVTIDLQAALSGYIETIFSGTPSHHRGVNTTADFITGFLYKKDKKHDHIPIPEPTHASSFVHIPVPMPFHALTFTLTYFGLCRKCSKLWYCDALQTANWSTKMKWVLPISVKKWYSFGTTEGPAGGAHGIQFSTRGYKNFLVLTDTWGRQEQWIHAIEEAIHGSSKHSAQTIATERALAIEIDNEVDNANVRRPMMDEGKGSLKREEKEGNILNPESSLSSVHRVVDVAKFQPMSTSKGSSAHEASNRLSVLVSRPVIRPSASLKGGAMIKDGFGMRHVASTPDLAKLEKAFTNK